MLYEDPELYDALFPPSPDHVEFYEKLATLHDGPVLELACGTGQLIVPIVRNGRRAVGIDNSPQMLRGARRRAAAAGVEIEFVEGDMRNFDLGERFALIFVARNSLLHLSTTADFAALFSSARRHLLEGAPGSALLGVHDIGSGGPRAVDRPPRDF